MEYVDHMKEYMYERAKRFVEDMGNNYPPELMELKAKAPDRLVALIEDGATPILRGLEDTALRASAFRAVTMISWSKLQAAKEK